MLPRPTIKLGIGRGGRLATDAQQRVYARIARLRDEGERLYAKANRLMGRNVQPPMPLFDDNHEGR